ncbi:hypothetical protein BKE38_07165 [Pseudoroseomonas deserti]|uniref:Uncharacterized protein n=1 Tax=Teichococcus deserti TaxID=1817963 RepID=A0A1V2H5W1_9PROT|nr:hypothetical protein [Pseudoroseomonas deserti]ONG56097.1 hypothetical protein BKE38_07165 [Pseudoroseomonas deserti]
MASDNADRLVDLAMSLPPSLPREEAVNAFEAFVAPYPLEGKAQIIRGARDEMTSRRASEELDAVTDEQQLHLEALSDWLGAFSGSAGRD